MDSFKKVISLSQASEISGYTQDYLGFLIRKGEIKGTKKGRAWFTTEEQVKEYLFKKKVRQEKFAIKEFFSPSRTKNIVIATVMFSAVVFLIFSNLDHKKINNQNEVHSSAQSNGGGVVMVEN